MLLHDLFRTQLCRFRHRNFVVKPRGSDHARYTVFRSACRTVYHVAHGVNHAYTQFGNAVGGDFYRFFRHEFWLCGHNGLAGTALGQFVPCPFFAIGVIDAGDYQFFHDTLN